MAFWDTPYPEGDYDVVLVAEGSFGEISGYMGIIECLDKRLSILLITSWTTTTQSRSYPPLEGRNVKVIGLPDIPNAINGMNLEALYTN